MKTDKSRKVVTFFGFLALGILLWGVRDKIRFYIDFESLGKNAQGYVEYRHRKTGTVFVLLPGGPFDMGSREGEVGRESDEGPLHRVKLSPFLIAKYELTQAQWRAVMGSNPSTTEGDDLPITNVSWNDCQEFCRRTGLSFPTEAQWEYALRAGTKTRFWSGNSDSDLGDVGWYAANSGKKLHDVGKKPANGFGIHDMHGNVWEWCVDVWDAKFYEQIQATRKDPVCTAGSENRVVRGGSFAFGPKYCRSAYRYSLKPGTRWNIYGFRPARSR